MIGVAALSERSFCIDNFGSPKPKWVRPSNSSHETRIRNSDTKLDVGFWWDLSFVTHPSFVYGAIHLFGNGKRNCFFLSFGNETRIRNSNPETKLVSYRRKRGPDTKLPNKQTVARMGPPASRGDRGAIRFIEDTYLQTLLCTCCMHRGIRESPGRIRRSCLC